MTIDDILLNTHSRRHLAGLTDAVITSGRPENESGKRLGDIERYKDFPIAFSIRFVGAELCYQVQRRR